MKDNKEIKDIMDSGGITGGFIATVGSQGKPTPLPIGFIDNNGLQQKVTEDTVFQCASLSKPVFAYLVLKLIQANKTNSSQDDWVGKFAMQFTLDTPLYEVFRDSQGVVLEGDKNPFLKLFNNQDQAKLITAKMALSHTTGLPIVTQPPYQFQFSPGQHYAYSGPGIKCLQMAIQELTGKNIEELAREHVFGPLGMTKSTYGANPEAAKSLETTATEYAEFIRAWVNDPDLQYAFVAVKPADSMNNDFFPDEKAVGRLVERIDVTDKKARALVAWGLGIGLVLNEEKQVIGAYHTGDSGDNTAQWRAGVGVVIDPKTKRCVEAAVYLTKSPNGHILADAILPAALKPGLDYFFPTYGFARNATELDGTYFNGMNPKLLIEPLRNKAYTTQPPIPYLKQDPQPIKTAATSTDSAEQSANSTSRMFELMSINPLASKTQPSPTGNKSKETEVSPTPQVPQPADNKTDEEPAFNPTPLKTTPDPFNQ